MMQTFFSHSGRRELSLHGFSFLPRFAFGRSTSLPSSPIQQSSSVLHAIGAGAGASRSSAASTAGGGGDASSGCGTLAAASVSTTGAGGAWLGVELLHATT